MQIFYSCIRSRYNGLWTFQIHLEDGKNLLNCIFFLFCWWKDKTDKEIWCCFAFSLLGNIGTFSELNYIWHCTTGGDMASHRRCDCILFSVKLKTVYDLVALQEYKHSLIQSLGKTNKMWQAVMMHPCVKLVTVKRLLKKKGKLFPTAHCRVPRCYQVTTDYRE
jgi:hypothetical protein